MDGNVQVSNVLVQQTTSKWETSTKWDTSQKHLQTCQKFTKLVQQIHLHLCNRSTLTYDTCILHIKCDYGCLTSVDCPTHLSWTVHGVISGWVMSGCVISRGRGLMSLHYINYMHNTPNITLLHIYPTCNTHVGHFLVQYEYLKSAPLCSILCGHKLSCKHIAIGVEGS